MRRGTASLLAAALFAAPWIAAPAQIPSGDNSAANLSRAGAPTAVRFVYPEQVSVAAKKSTAVELHFHIADGLHINSHTPHQKELIPTNLAVLDADGVDVSAVDFPAGTDFSFDFSPKEKLSIYSGDFVLRAHLTATPGSHLLEASLRYQACTLNTCYPPKTIPVAISIIAK